MSNSEEAIKYKNLGNKAFQEGKHQEAIDHFSRAIELNPDDHVFFSNRSGSFASLEKYEEALADAQRCVELKPDWAKGYARKGLAEFYLKKYDQSIETYKKCLELDPNNAQAKEGLERAEQEKTQSSAGFGFGNDQQQQFLQRLMQNPKTKEYLKDPSFLQKLQMMQTNPQLITAFMSDPKIAEAIKVMFGLPDNMDFGNFGGKDDQAGSSSQNAWQEDEDDKKESNGIFEEQKIFEEPPKKQEQPKKPQQQPKYEQHLDEAERIKNLGNEEYKKRNFQEAIKFYDQAIEKKPNEVLYYNNKAACYIELSNYDEAMSVVDKAIEISQETKLNDFAKIAKLYARKASIYNCLKNYDQAINFYEKSLLEDNNAKVKQDLKKVQLTKKEWEAKSYINPELAEKHNEEGKRLFLDGKFPEALKEYQEAIRRNPNDAKLYSNEASCYIKLMEFPIALKSIEKCLQLDPKFIKAFSKKGQIHTGLKEYHKAIEAYQQGLKLDPNNAECKEGIAQTNKKLYYSQETQQDAEERARHAMADPEIQAILRDPNMQVLLRNMQENPYNPENMKMMADPVIGAKIQKLIQAGILKTQ